MHLNCRNTIAIRDGKDFGCGVLIVSVYRLEIEVNCFRVNGRADGCFASLSTGDHIDSIPPPLRIRTGVITTSSFINSTDLFSANEFVYSLLQDRVFRLSVTP